MAPAGKKHKAAENAPLRKVSFVGGGMMASAILSALIKSKFTAPQNICVADPSEAVRERLANEYPGVKTAAAAGELASDCDALIIAVKPQYVMSVCDSIGHIDQSAIIISIAAGIEISRIESALRSERPVVRVMPNTPCMVGEMAAGFTAGTHAKSEAIIAKVQALLDAAGGTSVYVAQEKLLLGVTGVSGSGPAYIYMVIEALADGGVKAGLPRDVALKLAAQNVRGAATMVLETGKHPGELKDQVCSPGGATIEAVVGLEKSGLRAAMAQAVQDVVDKCERLANL